MIWLGLYDVCMFKNLIESIILCVVIVNIELMIGFGWWFVLVNVMVVVFGMYVIMLCCYINYELDMIMMMLDFFSLFFGVL